MSTRTRNAVTVSGADGPALLFAHGLGCDQNVWHYVSARFERTHKLILFDFVGFGASDLNAWNSEKYGSLQGHATDLIEVCQDFCPDGATVVGHSFGGMVSLLAASQRSELFAKLILMNVSPYHANSGNYAGGLDPPEIDRLISSIEEDLPGWSAHLAPIAIGNDGRPSVVSELEGHFCRNTPSIFAHQARIAFQADIRDDLAQVTTQCTVLKGWDDPFVTETASHYLIANLPHAEAIEMFTSGHYPHLNDPEVVTSAIRNALRKA